MLSVLNYDSEKGVSCHVVLLKVIHYNRYKILTFKLTLNQDTAHTKSQNTKLEESARESKATFGFITDQPCMKYRYCSPAKLMLLNCGAGEQS